MAAFRGQYCVHLDGSIALLAANGAGAGLATIESQRSAVCTCWAGTAAPCEAAWRRIAIKALGPPWMETARAEGVVLILETDGVLRSEACLCCYLYLRL